jgi:hypothetical protein
MVKRPATFLGAISLVACCLLLAAACGGSSNAPAATARPSGATASPAPQGPFATIDPRMGPPGSQIVFSGGGWPSGISVVVTGETAPGQTAAPLTTVTADRAGGIAGSFRLEKTAGGDNLKVGPYQLIFKSGNSEVRTSFQVQTPRPVQPTPGGG